MNPCMCNTHTNSKQPWPFARVWMRHSHRSWFTDIYFLLFQKNFFGHEACGISVLWSGIEPVPPASEMWTTREVLVHWHLNESVEHWIQFLSSGWPASKVYWRIFSFSVYRIVLLGILPWKEYISETINVSRAFCVWTVHHFLPSL